MSILSEPVTLSFYADGTCLLWAGDLQFESADENFLHAQAFLEMLLKMLHVDPRCIEIAGSGAIRFHRDRLRFGTGDCDKFPIKDFIELLDATYNNEDVLSAIENLWRKYELQEKKLAESGEAES